MEHFSRFFAAIAGNPIDRWAYALWRHFPKYDRTPEGFSDAHIRFYRQYDPDVLKLSPHGRYCIVDWGGEIGPVNPVSGSPSTKYYPLRSAEDYETLKELDPSTGEFGRQLKGVRMIAKELEDQVPLMMTVFSPFMVASKLDADIHSRIQESPEEVHRGLDVITRVMINFGRAVIDEGSHGLFVASQHSTFDTLTEKQFLSFEQKYTYQLLRSLHGK
ncbi:MAG: uroporphyrinogen decarboxylase family protein, partial [Candidatus Ranarchaeia archaeon]